MEGINKKYDIEIEVLTPLSIGAGAEKDWVRGVDFVVDKGTLYKLNLKKMVANGLDVAELTDCFASKNENLLKSKLAGKLNAVSDFTMPFPAESDNDVKTFVKNQLSGNPVLTGSSLKGSLRSVLFQYLGAKSKDGVEVLGNLKEGENFMRFIKISDAEFDGTTLVNTKIFNLQGDGKNWRGGWKHQISFTDGTCRLTGFNTLYESLVLQQKGYASLMLSGSLYDNFAEYARPHIKSEKKNPIMHDGISTLFAIVNMHTQHYLEKERAFFEKFPADRTDEIIASIDALLNQIPADNSYCILKMSAGSGFHSITGDWQFEDYTTTPLDRKRVKEGMVNPKSRKIAVWNETLSLMGFVKLRSMSKVEVRTLEEQRKAEMFRKEQERKAQADAIRLKAEQEAQEQREKEERQAQYNTAIAEIQQLIDAEQYESAWEKFEATSKLYPEGKQNVIDVEFLRRKADEKKYERQHMEFEAKQEQARKEKAGGGLVKLLNEKYEFGQNVGNYKVASFKICLQKVSSWMKVAEAKQVPSDQQAALYETVKRLIENPDKKEVKTCMDFKGSQWQQIAAFVGHDTAQQWFDEIVRPS